MGWREQESPLLGRHWVLTLQGACRRDRCPRGGDAATDAGLGGWTHLQQGRESWSLGWTWSSRQNAGISLPALSRVKAATTQTWAT